MRDHHYIRDNTPEIRSVLHEHGYRICSCCSFKCATWLSVYPPDFYMPDLAYTVHGFGYGCEYDCTDKCPDKCIRCGLKEDDNIHVFTGVEDYLNAVNKI